MFMVTWVMTGVQTNLVDQLYFMKALQSVKHSKIIVNVINQLRWWLVLTVIGWQSTMPGKGKIVNVAAF